MRCPKGLRSMASNNNLWKRQNSTLSSQYTTLSVFHTVPCVSENVVYAIKCRMIFKRRMIFTYRTLDPAGLNMDFNFILNLSKSARSCLVTSLF